MHRALVVPDVLTHIISQVESKDTLAALARTSSVVSGCALDKLWHTIENVVLLARCMPPGLWDEVEGYASVRNSRDNAVEVVYSSRLSLSSNPREGDWLGPRFKAYAERIRHLNTANRVVDREKWPVRRSSWMPALVDHPTDPDALPIPARARTNSVTSAVHLDVLRAWGAYSCEVAPLFSNLLHLRWDNEDYGELELAPLLLTPSLSSLTVLPSARNPGSDVQAQDIVHLQRGTAAVGVVQEAMVHCPSLRALNLFRRRRQHFRRVPAVDTTLGSRLEQLREFRCGALAPSSTLRHLASLPHLEVFEAPVGANMSLVGLPCVFPAARELRFLSAPMQHLLALVAAVQSARVHTFELNASDNPGPSSRLVGELLALVVAHPSADALRQLRFAPDGNLNVLGSEYLALADVRPLLRLVGLRDVVLKGYAVDPAGDTVAQMLAAWPALETLELAPGSQLTLAQLFSAARTNGTLRELACTVAVPAGKPLPDTRGLVHTGLHRLQIAVDGKQQRYMVAELLVTVFPALFDLDDGSWGMQELLDMMRYA